MNLRKSVLIVGFLFLFFGFFNSARADFAKGKEAYDAGDYAAAFQELLIDAKQGDAASQEFVGYLYSMGQGVPKSVGKALQWYRLAAEQGFAPAQTRLGNHYQFGVGVNKDKAEGRRWHRLAADQGNVHAQYALGLVYAKGDGVKKNTKEAARWYQLAADQGSPYAQYSLGELYYKGKGVKKNREEAARLYRLAADQGNPDAQIALGKMHEKGKGAIKDKIEAERLYRLAAEQNHRKGQYALGWLLYRKSGVKSRSVTRGSLVKGKGYKYKVKGNDQSQVEGYAWMRLATSGSRTFSMPSEKMMIDGLQETMDATTLFKAERLFQQWKGNTRAIELNKMADDGRPGAQFELGIMHAEGRSVLKNAFIAYHWFNLAYANGFEDARKGRNRMCKRIVSDQEHPGSLGLDHLAIEYFEAQPAAYPGGQVKTVLANLCAK
jgi:TPR repeat protein